MTLRVKMTETRNAGSGSFHVSGQEYDIEYATARLYLHHDWATYVSGEIVPNAGVPVLASTNLTGKITATAGGVEIPLAQVHPAYFCHLNAATLTADDGTWYDASGAGNNASRGANLSIAQMAAVGGYATVVAPVTGTLDSVLHLPSLNFDFNAGEALLIYWRGKMAAPAAQVNLMGDSESNFRNGFKLRIATSGKVDLAMYSATGPTNLFGPAGTANLADGAAHDFAVLIDGSAKTLNRWEDGVLVGTTAAFGASGCDTTNTNDFMLGAGYKVPTNATGIAASTRCMAMLRWGAAWTKPTAAQVTTAVQRLRSNPSRLLTASDL